MYFSEKCRTLSRVQNGTVQLGTAFFKLQLTSIFRPNLTRPSKRKIKKANYALLYQFYLHKQNKPTYKPTLA